MGHYIDNQTSPEAILAELGRRLAAWRIARQYTQAQLAGMAGVSRTTLQRMEAGQGGELRTFICLLTALGNASALEALLPEIGPGPVDLLKLAGKQRKRVRHPARSAVAGPPGQWKWGDEQ